MEELITACPLNCYSTCTFRVRVKDGRIVKILPFKDNLATPEGPCIKGLSYIERTSSKERIVHPLIRMADGSFSKIPSEEALGIIAGRLKSIKDEYGALSIFWYRGSGMSGLTNEIGSEFWRAFGGATTTFGNLCWPAGLEAVRLTMGAVKHNVPWDIVNANTIIIWGKNPAETNIQEIKFIAEARRNGSRIVVIDPIRTPTADKADLFLSPEPGTDAALALAVAKILCDEGLTDDDFLKKNVKGLDEFRKSLKITVYDAAQITGIPPETIQELAYIIGNGGPVTIITGYGLQRHVNGGQTIRSILSLVILTGNIGKKGAGFNYANLQSYIFDDLKEPLSYYPDPSSDSPFRRCIAIARLGKDIQQTSGPSIKAAWIERGNPVLQVPDSTSVRKAFMHLDFKVVIEQFMTDTASLADIILPAKDMFSQPDIIGSYWSPYVQYKPAILESPGEVRPESEIYYSLAGKLGLIFDEKKLPPPGNEYIDEWLERRIGGYSHLKLCDLKKGPVLAPNLQEIAWSDLKFETASGKIELHSDEAARLWGVSVLPEFIETRKSSYPLKFLTPNAGNRLHSQFGNLEIIRNSSEEPALLMSYSDARSRNVRTGDLVKIFNENGSLILKVRLSERIRKGIVVLPNGIWLSEGGGGNFLTGAIETDMGYGAAFHDEMVEIEKTENHA